MLSDKSKLTEQFELEVWLYIDNELDPERKAFWDKQVSQSEELKTVLNEAKEMLNLYSSESLHDIDDPTYLKMIEKATKKRWSLVYILKKLFGSDAGGEESIISGPKVAFGSLLVIAGLVMFLLSEKPNGVKHLSSDLLDWEAESISEQMQEINGGLSMIEDEQLKEYLMYQKTKDEWSKDVYSIEQQIENLIEKTEEKSL